VAAEIKAHFPEAAVNLVPSSGGVFDVVADGRLVFSKKATGRHTDPDEIIALLSASSGPTP
jgi:selenoprotein W-related protein